MSTSSARLFGLLAEKGKAAPAVRAGRELKDPDRFAGLRLMGRPGLDGEAGRMGNGSAGNKVSAPGHQWAEGAESTPSPKSSSPQSSAVGGEEDSAHKNVAHKNADCAEDKARVPPKLNQGVPVIRFPGQAGASAHPPHTADESLGVGAGSINGTDTNRPVTKAQPDAQADVFAASCAVRVGVTVRLPAGSYRRLKSIAKENDASMQSIISRAVSQWMAQNS